MSSSNAFLALSQTKPKAKKSSSKDKPKKAAVPEEPQVSTEELERAIFSQPSINISNWADDSDEDGFLPQVQEEPVEPGWSKAPTTGRASSLRAPLPVVSNGHTQAFTDEEEEEYEEESDDGHEIDIEAELGVELAKDDDDEDEEDTGAETEQQPIKPAAPTPASRLAAEPEKTLSKKELKKKEMEELDAVFASLGIQNDTNKQDSAAGEGKKKKKNKKAKSEEPEEPGNTPTNATAAAQQQPQEEQQDANNTADQDNEDDGPVDPAVAKARLLAAQKKKAEDKKKALASAAALAEAKARKAKLSKQKDTKSFNQPGRSDKGQKGGGLNEFVDGTAIPTTVGMKRTVDLAMDIT